MLKLAVESSISCIFMLLLAVGTAAECHFDEATSAREALIDANVSPCTDFFNYACGNWHLPYALRALRAHDTLTAASAANKLQLLQYLQNQGEAHTKDEDEHDDSISSNSVVRTFYDSCMKQTNTASAATYMSALQMLNASRILNFSLVSGNGSQAPDQDNGKWWQIAAELRLMGVDAFWQLLLRPNWQSAEQQIFYIVAPKFGHMQDASIINSNTNNEQLQSLDAEEIIFLEKRYIKYLLLDLGLRTRPAIKLANELVAFEVAIMQFKDPHDLLTLNAPQSLHVWQQQLPELHLLEYFEALLLPPSSSHDENHVDRVNALRNMLLVVDIKYLRKLHKFLMTADPHLLAKYMLVKYLTHFELHTDVDELYCLQQLQNFLPHQLTQLFAELQFQHNRTGTQHHNQRMHSDVSGLFDKLKYQFEVFLQKTEIFEHDAPGKLLSLEKLRAMRLILPQYTPENTTAATPDYKLTTDYGKNLLELWRVRTERELGEIRQSLKSDDATMEFGANDDENIYAPLDVNAYYRLKKNAIELPAGLLTTPFYNECMSRPQLYGRLVYIIAHELLHGYDYDGLNYDKVGNVANNLRAKSIIKYGTRASCYFAERYLNAPLNINENMADSEGLRLALETLRAEYTAHAESTLPDQHLKEFFLSFAQSWCGGKQQHGSEHRERVNNVVSNFKEFSQIYKCHKYSNLNPENKCQIW